MDFIEEGFGQIGNISNAMFKMYFTHFQKRSSKE
jgi:hypothetical protein